MGKKMTSWFQQMLSPTLLLSSPRSCFSSLSPFFFRRFTAARSAAAAAAALSPNNIHSHSQSHSLVQTLTPVQKDQISLYVGALLQWNQRMNLTAVTEESEVMTRHVADSLALIPPIITSYLSHCRRQSTPVGDGDGDGDGDDDVALNLNLVDVGSGAGLPGLIFAISCPSWKVTLLESMQKRCLFLEHVVDLTGLPNVEIVCERAEDRTQANVLTSENHLMLQ